MPTLGIDIGGTKISAVLWGEKILNSEMVSTPKTKQKFFEVLGNLIKNFQADGFDAIGVGVAAVVDARKQKVVSAPNIKYLNGVDLGKFLKKFSPRTAVLNDADCALFAEMQSGVLRAKKHAVLIALGTGIGSGIMINGQMYQGLGSAGEIGKTVLDNGKTAEELFGGKKIKDFSSKGYRPVVKYGAQLIANVINTLNPEIVVLSGGQALKAPANFMSDLKKEVKRYIYAPSLKNTPIVLAKHGVDAVAVGAIHLVNLGSLGGEGG